MPESPALRLIHLSSTTLRGDKQLVGAALPPKHSGRAAINAGLGALGYDLSPEMVDRIVLEVEKLAKREKTNEDEILLGAVGRLIGAGDGVTVTCDRTNMPLHYSRTPRRLTCPPVAARASGHSVCATSSRLRLRNITGPDALYLA